MKKALLALAAFSMLFLTNCKKDDDDNDNKEPSLTKESLAGNYKITGLWLKINGVPNEIDVMEDRVEDCERDDIYNLKTDFTYNYTDAGIKCTDPGDYQGTWALPGNNKIDLDGEILDVVKWDGKNLHVSQSGTDPTTGQSGSIRLEFTKQ